MAGSGAVTAEGVSIASSTGGGDWSASGSTGSVAITATAADTATIAATGGADFVAGGTAPTITVAAGKTLRLAANTTINLGGDPTAALGTITLTGAAGGHGTLALDATAKVLIGAGTGGHDIGGVTTVKIANKTATATSFAVDDLQVVTVGEGQTVDYLVQLGGTNEGSIAATSAATSDVVIASNSAVTGQ
jgi:hypothetical protein